MVRNCADGLIGIPIVSTRRGKYPRMTTADRSFVHSIVIFSAISYHTLFAFASVLTKKYTVDTHPFFTVLKTHPERKRRTRKKPSVSSKKRLFDLAALRLGPLPVVRHAFEFMVRAHADAVRPPTVQGFDRPFVRLPVVDRHFLQRGIIIVFAPILQLIAREHLGRAPLDDELSAACRDGFQRTRRDADGRLQRSDEAEVVIVHRILRIRLDAVLIARSRIDPVICVGSVDPARFGRIEPALERRPPAADQVPCAAIDHVPRRAFDRLPADENALVDVLNGRARRRRQIDLEPRARGTRVSAPHADLDGRRARSDVVRIRNRIILRVDRFPRLAVGHDDARRLFRAVINDVRGRALEFHVARVDLDRRLDRDAGDVLRYGIHVCADADGTAPVPSVPVLFGHRDGLRFDLVADRKFDLRILRNIADKEEVQRDERLFRLDPAAVVGREHKAQRSLFRVAVVDQDRTLRNGLSGCVRCEKIVFAEILRAHGVFDQRRIEGQIEHERRQQLVVGHAVQVHIGPQKTVAVDLGDRVVDPAARDHERIIRFRRGGSRKRRKQHKRRQNRCNDFSHDRSPPYRQTFRSDRKSGIYPCFM